VLTKNSINAIIKKTEGECHMEQKEYQIDYSEGEEPLVILPLCVGAAVLHGAFFRWFSSLDGGDEKLVIFMKLLYWSAVIGFGGIAAWRLIRTIHATSKGLEYRFLGKTRKIIPWNEFSCACKCRSYWCSYGNDCCNHGNLCFLCAAAL